MSLHDRIKEARKSKGLTQTELGEIIGVAKTTIAGYEKLYEPSVGQLGAIADALDVDVDFLLQDEIKHRRDIRATPEEMKTLVKKYRLLDKHGKEAVDAILDVEHRRCTEQAQAKPEERMVQKLVYINPAAAGMPLYAESDFEWMSFPESEVPSGADFGIRISGRSMEPTVADGSIVWVHKTIDLESGTVGVFMLNDSAVCKRYFKNSDGTFRLESDNPKFDPVPVTEFDHVVPVGKVIGTA